MGKHKIVLTGGTGYIGSHTAVALLDQGYDLVIVDNLSNSFIEVLESIKEICGKRPQFIELDLCDRAKTSDFFRQHKDAVGIIHFAALKAVGESVQDPLNYYYNNLGSMLHVLQGMQSQNIPNLIFSSSATVYGQPEKLPVTEESPVVPAESPYGNTKQINEEIISEAVHAGQIQKAISLRYFNPVGAHFSGLIGELPIGIPNNLMPFITQTAIGIREKLSVFGGDYNTLDGTAIRDYIHVVDLAEAHVVAIERLIHDKQQRNYEVFNLGTGHGSSVLQVIDSFERVTGVDVPYQIVDRRAGDVESVYANVDKAAKDLKWRTKYNLDDMTNTAWQWEKNYRKKISDS